MNSNIQELYQAVILDHNRNPKNFRKMEDATIVKEGHNPLCGDHLHIYVKIDGDKKVQDISFEGEGCAISKASTSMMTQALKGKTLSEARELFDEFHELLTGKLDPDTQDHQLGKLKLFAGIWQYPSRVKCASLAWHTFNSAVDGETDTTKTE